MSTQTAGGDAHAPTAAGWELSFDEGPATGALTTFGQMGQHMPAGRHCGRGLP